MEEVKVKKWSNLLLDKMLEYRRSNPGFTFALRQRNRNERLEKGYWFHGDDNYISVGFTARSDDSNKTQSVGLVFNNFQDNTADCFLEIVFKTEPRADLVALYRNFISANSGFVTIDQPYYKHFKYHKSYLRKDPIKNLEHFLSEDWKKLSSDIIENGLEDLFFVPEEDFQTHLKRIETIRTTEPQSMTLKKSESINQFKIFADVHGEELEFEVSEEKHPSGGLFFRGNAIGSNAWFSFVESEGFVTNLKLSSTISTSKEVLEARINEVMDARKEQEFAGFELTDETENIETRDLNPYDPEKIKIRRDLLSLREMLTMMEDDMAIDLNPEFQRNFVWDNARKSRLIESLLLGIPIPLFYFAENKNGTFNVIDGLQRMTVFRQYMLNEFPLKGLEYLEDCEGLYFKSDGVKVKPEKALPIPMMRRVAGTQVVVNVIEASSPAEVKYDIFKRINIGGKPLNNQEIRNCMAKPVVRTMLKNCAHHEKFIQATGNSISDKRMDGQEMVLRYCGFWLTKRGLATYSGSMTSFLDGIIEKLNEMKETDLQRIQKEFLNAMHNCYHLFGRYCFRKVLTEHLQSKRSQSLNKSMFTVWGIVLSDYKPEKVTGYNDFESFAHIQAKELDKKGEFYDKVTTKTNDRLILNRVFDIVEQLAKTNLKQN